MSSVCKCLRWWGLGVLASPPGERAQARAPELSVGSCSSSSTYEFSARFDSVQNGVQNSAQNGVPPGPAAVHATVHGSLAAFGQASRRLRRFGGVIVIA